jgi:hypothetical protein
MVGKREQIDPMFLGKGDPPLVLVEQQVLEGMCGADLSLLVDEIERQADRVLQPEQGSPHLQIEGVS